MSERRRIGAALLAAAVPLLAWGTPVSAAPASAARAATDQLAASAYPPPVGSTRLANQRYTGEPAIGLSFPVELSADGRYLAFVSLDPELVPGKHKFLQVYLRDLSTGAISLVSRTPDGAEAKQVGQVAAMSADGTRIVFQANGTYSSPEGLKRELQIYLYDATTDSAVLVSHAPDGTGGARRSIEPAISGDGSVVVFASKARNLVPGEPLGADDHQLYAYDVASGTVRLLTKGPGGAAADGESRNPSVSADGTRIAFSSTSTNLGPSGDDDDRDLFLLDTRTRTVRQVSVSPTDDEGFSDQPAISADGSYVAFESSLAGLTDDPVGRYDNDLYRWSAATGAFDRLNPTVDGEPTPLGANSEGVSISADGSLVAYASAADNLVVGDDNDVSDVFLRDVDAGTTVLVSRARTGEPADGLSYRPAISAPGNYLAFASRADDLSDRDNDGTTDVFVHRLS